MSTRSRTVPRETVSTDSQLWTNGDAPCTKEEMTIVLISLSSLRQARSRSRTWFIWSHSIGELILLDPFPKTYLGRRNDARERVLGLVVLFLLARVRLDVALVVAENETPRRFRQFLLRGFERVEEEEASFGERLAAATGVAIISQEHRDRNEKVRTWGTVVRSSCRRELPLGLRDQARELQPRGLRPRKVGRTHADRE